MSRRPWPDDAHPSPEQLIEWCRTGMTADVVPYLKALIEDAAALHDARLRGRLTLGEVLGGAIRLNEALSITEVVRNDVHYVEIPRAVLSRLLEGALS